MEDQVPSSIPSPPPGQITPEILEQMKQHAREMAVAQHMAQQQVKKEYQVGNPEPSLVSPFQPQEAIYVRRNLTLAELIVILVVSIGVVTGVQVGWKFASENLPRIHIEVK